MENLKQLQSYFLNSVTGNFEESEIYIINFNQIDYIRIKRNKEYCLIYIGNKELFNVFKTSAVLNTLKQ